MRSIYDLQSLLYLGSYVGLIVAQWVWGFSCLMFGGLLFVSVGIQVVHHNHAHLGIWHSKWLNHLTNHFISVISAVPCAMMYGSHLKNHHVHQHGLEDVTRTYRWGDHNHIWGYLIHPFQAFSVLIPMFCKDFFIQWPQKTRFSRDLLLQVCLIGMLWAILAAIDWQKFLLLVFLPQAFGLHWLLGANYFQHAHCDGESRVDYARNFTGAVNLLLLNIGFHTAHHDHPRAHWSTLRTLHEENRHSIDPRLCKKSFFVYVVQTFLLGLLFESYRSKSLHNDPDSVTNA